MRDYKKMPQAASVGGLQDVTDLQLPYNAITGDGQGGYSMAEVPFGADNGGQHGVPFTTDVTLAKAGRT
jgi:hypothetical protein